MRFRPMWAHLFEADHFVDAFAEWHAASRHDHRIAFYRERRRFAMFRADHAFHELLRFGEQAGEGNFLRPFECVIGTRTERHDSPYSVELEPKPTVSVNGPLTAAVVVLAPAAGAHHALPHQFAMGARLVSARPRRMAFRASDGRTGRIHVAEGVAFPPSPL